MLNSPPLIIFSLLGPLFNIHPTFQQDQIFPLISPQTWCNNNLIWNAPMCNNNNHNHNFHSIDGEWNNLNCEKSLFLWYSKGAPLLNNFIDSRLFDWNVDFCFWVKFLFDFMKMSLIKWLFVEDCTIFWRFLKNIV